MAINPSASFPGKIEAPSSEYPYGKARNVTSPGDGTGTPWVANLVNDIFGLFQSLLTEAAIVPSGDPDEVGASQLFNAMTALFDQSAAGSTSAAGLLQMSDDPASTSTALAATINAVNAVRLLATATIAGTTSNWRMQIGRFKVQGGTTSISANTGLNITFSGSQTAYTGAHLAFFPWIIDDTTDDDDVLKGHVVSSTQGRIRNTNSGPATAAYMSFGYDA